MFTGNMKGLKYVAVEVIAKNATKVTDLECGAFMGIVHQKDLDNNTVKFIVLLTKPTTIRMYNANEFDVVTIAALDKDMSYMTVYTNEDEDQRAALTTLSEVVKTMAEEGRIFANDPEKELINVDSYKELPDAVLHGNNLSDSSVTTKNNGSTVNNSTNKIYGTGTSLINGYATKTQAKPTVLNFRRKGKLPSENRLNKIRSLVMELSSGKAQARSLPVPKCDQAKADTDTVKEADTMTKMERQAHQDMTI